MKPQMKLTLEFENEVTTRCWNEPTPMAAELMLANLIARVAVASGIENLSNVFSRAVTQADYEMSQFGHIEAELFTAAEELIEGKGEGQA